MEAPLWRRKQSNLRPKAATNKNPKTRGQEMNGWTIHIPDWMLVILGSAAGLLALILMGFGCLFIYMHFWWDR